MSFRLTEAADQDIERILGDTLELFGPKQFKVYSDLIDQALRRLGASPHGIGTSTRDEIAPGVRSLRLDTVTGRRGSAAHSIYYLPPAEGAGSAVVILRLLHDRMEPNRHVSTHGMEGIPDDFGTPSRRRK